MNYESNEYGEKLNALAEIIKRGRVVFFGGAGVSTESGIPDFRSSTGLYSQKQGGLSAEEIISHDYFMTETAAFFDYYRHAFIYSEARPNKAHLALAELAKAGLLSAIVTQNVDGLHTAANKSTGAKCPVWELHGCIDRNFCMSCGKSYPLSAITETSDVPRCGYVSPDGCGGIIKPDVVLYGEQLDSKVIRGAVNAIGTARSLIVGGTSLAVYPAAGFLEYFSGNDLVLINKSATSFDSEAKLIFRESIGTVLDDVKQLFK